MRAVSFFQSTPETPLAGWNSIEQSYKRLALKWIERLFSRKVLSPDVLIGQRIERILVVRQHDVLGDFILSTPAFTALKSKFPSATIGALVREQPAEVLKHNPDVNEILVFPKEKHRRNMKSLIVFWRQLRSNWDLVIVLNTVSHSLTSDLLATLSGARFIVGSDHRVFPGCTRNFMYNLLAPYAEGVRSQSERNLDIVRHVGVAPPNAHEIMHLTPQELQAAATRLTDLGMRETLTVVAIHPGAGKLANRWPVGNFVTLAERLTKVHGFQIVLFWGKSEEELKEEFTQSATFEFITFPPSDLRDFAASLRQCDVVVCNDTGVLHVAASVGVPLVGIFGPTDPAEWKPVGSDFRAVRGKDSVTANVTVDQVYDTLIELLRHDR